MKRIETAYAKAAINRMRLRQRGFALSLLSVGLFLFPVLPAHVNVATDSKASVRNERTAKPQCPACAQSETSTIYAPLIQLAESSGTELNLNCRSRK